jgi:hypothetical protein
MKTQPAHHFRFRITTLLASAALAIVSWAFAPTSADAQVLVYDVEFEEFDSSINFTFFERGFFVVEALGGNGSFIFTFEDDGKDFYLTAADAGELFFAVKPGMERAVMRASAVTDSAQTQYLIIGKLDSTVSFNLRGQRVSARVATRMTGNVLASDSEPDVEFTPDAEIGFAGFAQMSADLNEKRTLQAKRTDQTVAGAVQGIIDELTELGFEDDAQREDDNGDGGDNPDPDNPDNNPDPGLDPDPDPDVIVEP